MNTSVGAMYNDLQGLGVDAGRIEAQSQQYHCFLWIIFWSLTVRCKTTAKKRTVAAHEAGHYLSGAFYLAYSPYSEIKNRLKTGRLRLPG